ncbi:MAG: hypothetical protein KAT32_03325 [Candidatus Moranbacteria bacterium]|nr:hypothetical protein [Candidatus Moranbacteria bacterium]
MHKGIDPKYLRKWSPSKTIYSGKLATRKKQNPVVDDIVTLSDGLIESKAQKKVISELVEKHSKGGMRTKDLLNLVDELAFSKDRNIRKHFTSKKARDIVKSLGAKEKRERYLRKFREKPEEKSSSNQAGRRQFSSKKNQSVNQWASDRVKKIQERVKRKTSTESAAGIGSGSVEDPYKNIGKMAGKNSGSGSSSVQTSSRLKGGLRGSSASRGSRLR